MSRTSMLTEEQAAEIRARIKRHQAWLGDRTSYYPHEVPEDAQVTNEERSDLEVFEFITNPPAKYVLYIDTGFKLARTWTGAKLGYVVFGRTWTDNFGGLRTSIQVWAINGKRYVGTYYRSSGDYARVKLAKHQG